MSDLKTTIYNLERRYWQSILDKDGRASRDLTGDPCLVTGNGGLARLSKERFRQMLCDGRDWNLISFEMSDVEIEQLTSDVVVIGYRVREELSVHGQPLVLESCDASTWVFENGAWVCSVHSESILGAPDHRCRGAWADLRADA